MTFKDYTHNDVNYTKVHETLSQFVNLFPPNPSPSYQRLFLYNTNPREMFALLKWNPETLKIFRESSNMYHHPFVDWNRNFSGTVGVCLCV